MIPESLTAGRFTFDAEPVAANVHVRVSRVDAGKRSARGVLIVTESEWRELRAVVEPTPERRRLAAPIIEHVARRAQ